MKIAYLNTHFREDSFDGGSTHIREFINEMVAAGNVIFADRSNHHPKVIRIRKGVISYLKTLLISDVVYIRYQGEITRSMKFIASIMKLIPKKSIKVWEFNTIPPFALLKGKYEQNVEEQISFLRSQAKNSDLAVCVTEKMADYVKQMFGWKRVLVVPNGSNPKHFKPGLPSHTRMNYFANSLNIVWTGSLFEKWNDFDLLVKAADYLWSIGQENIFFHLIGSFPGDISQITPPNVFLYGSQSYNSLPNWLSAMDVGLILYKNDQATFGSPIKFFDYLSSGLAVISTGHPQVKRILQGFGIEAFVLEENTPENLVNKILLLMNNKTMMNQYKIKARKIIEDKYNWRNSINTIITLLEKLVYERK